MTLRQHDVEAVEFKNFSLKKFNTQYLLKNQPVAVRSMSENWNATSKWTPDYLSKTAGESTSILSILYHKAGDTSLWSLASQQAMSLPGSLDYSLELISNNSITSGGSQPALHFLDEDLIRAPSLRHDYEFPYLHSFMRLQRASISIWPQLISSMTPRQISGEQFVCLVDGELSVKLMSPVFSQNLYQGVFEGQAP